MSILGRSRVVITDRLHAHILSTLLGRSNVVLDNNYGKISNFIEAWTKDFPASQRASDPVAAMAQAAALAAVNRA